jgi:hypothetical protein
MADIKLGLSREAVEGAKETYEGPRTPFPANKMGYTKYSALVTDIQIKTSTDGNKSWLWLQVTNGAHQESILINLDPSDIAPTTPPTQVKQAVDRNLQTLLRAVKVLGISNAAGDGIDTNKFERAKGTLIAFGVKQGDLNANTGYYKYYTSFYGKADALVPVSEPIGGVTSKSTRDDEDVPF